jgi:hypothetical protein
MSNRCLHQRFHSGASRYCHERAQIRYVVMCDGCNEELRELGTVDYRPRFEPGSPHRRGPAGRTPVS